MLTKTQTPPPPPPSRGSLGNTPCLWFDSEESVRAYFGRIAGFADEIASANDRPRSIDHKGWFTYPDGDPSDVYRGAVVLLPHGVAIPAVYESCNDQYAVSLDLSDWQNATDTENRGHGTPHHLEAARLADRWAQIAAEKECDYQEKFNRAYQLSERLAKLDKLGQFADGSRLSAYDPSERDTLLAIEALRREFMVPCVELIAPDELSEYFHADDEREALEDWPIDNDGDPLPRAYFARLSADGYLDATEWAGPFTTIREALEYLADQYEPDSVNDKDLDPDTLALMNDPDCADHFPDPRADELLSASPARLSFAGVGRRWIAFNHFADCLELVRRADGASLFLQGDDANQLRADTALGGIDAAGDDYSTLDVFN